MDTYEQWLRRFLRFHQRRHPREMGSKEVNAFLTHLAVEGQVSASTQNQALSALLFLYRELLERDLDLEGVVRARAKRRLPVVLTEEEVRSVLQRLEGSEALVAGLLYGSGLRLMEALRLRVRHLDFNRQELTVRHGKGGKDRRTMLPKRLSKKLQIHLEKVRTVHRRDLIDGWGAERSAGSWYQQAGQLPQLASFVCHTPFRERTGHSHNSRIDGPQGSKKQQ